MVGASQAQVLHAMLPGSATQLESLGEEGMDTSQDGVGSSAAGQDGR